MCVCVFQVVGSRGTIEIDPRATMAKESEIRGMALFASDMVRGTHTCSTHSLSHTHTHTL